MASNFLIDTSKKALLFNDDPTGTLSVPKSSTNSTLLAKMALRGDLDTKALQKVGFTYKEEFEEGSKVLDDAFNKYSTQAKAIIDKILSDSIAGKLSNSISQAENSDLKAKLTTLMTMAMAAAPGDNDKQIQTMLDSFNLALRYRIPYRKKIPAMNASGNTFTLKFAYGKCNLFNAKEEVWLPIAYIKNILCPRVTPADNGNPGLLNVSSSRAGVPYTQQSLVHVLNATKSFVIKDENGNNTTPDMTSYMKALQTASKELIAKNAEAEAVDAAENYLRSIVDGFQGGDKDDKKENWKKIEELVPNINTGRSSLKDLARNWKDVDKGPLGGVKESGRENFVNHIDAEWNTWKNTYLSNDKINLQQVGDNKFKTLITEDASDKDTNSLIKILSNIVNYQINVEGYAANAVYQKLKANNTLFYLYYGYPQSYVHSQDALLNYFNEKTGAAKVRLGPFIPEEVEFLYDMEHTDGDGYPMAGEIVFKSLFAIAPYGEGLVLDSEECNLGKNDDPPTFSTPSLLGLSGPRGSDSGPLHVAY